MKNLPICPDCGVEMEQGFIPDLSYREQQHEVLKVFEAEHSAFQTFWHPGTVDDTAFVGLKSGYFDLTESQALRVIAFRCPECSLLRTYAPPAKSLRPVEIIEPAIDESPEGDE